jgi:hypothetical protein
MPQQKILRHHKKIPPPLPQEVKVQNAYQSRRRGGEEEEKRRRDGSPKASDLNCESMGFIRDF